MVISTKMMIDGGAAPAPVKTTTPAPAPTPAPVAAAPTPTPVAAPAAVNTSNLAGIATTSAPITPAVIKPVIAAVTQIVAASPAVVNAPANTAPAPAAIQQATTAAIAAIAPIVAPQLSQTVLNALGPIVSQAILASPAVAAAPVGQTITPAAVDKIVNTVATAPAVTAAVAAPAPTKAVTPAAVPTPVAVAASTPAPAVVPKPAAVTTPAPVATPAPTSFVPTSQLDAANTANTAAAAAPVGTTGLTAAQLQQAVAQLGSGQPLTTAQSSALGLPTPALTPAELQTAVATLGSGGTLTPTQSAALGITPVTPTGAAASTPAPAATPVAAVTPAAVTPAAVAPVISDATKDAFAMLTDLFTSYGLGSLAGEIAGYMTSGLTAGEALIKLKTNPTGAYATRFAGNFARTKAGLNVLSESAYIDLENSYANTLKAYGLGNMLSTDSKTNWKTFSDYIANDISAVEFKERIDTVEKRVINADSATKDLFKEWYPSITDKDLVAYFLNPTQTIDKLKAKTSAAEIGAAFTGQGLTTSQSSAEGFAAYGIDRAGALQGAAQIKEVLPTSEKLSSIYKEAGINYTQKTGESEFLKTNADAAEQRRRLKSMERGKFSGDSGVSSQVGSLNRTTQGAF